MPPFTLMNIAVFLATVGYGIMFPLPSIRLEKMGLSGAMTGVHSCMPALGWIAGSFLMPWLQSKLDIKHVVLGFLITGVIALAATAVSTDYLTLTLLRFFFGGGIGMFFRGIEYWITASSDPNMRGRAVGIYSAVFMFGIAIGSFIQPMLRSQDQLPFMAAIGCFLAAGTILKFSSEL